MERHTIRIIRTSYIASGEGPPVIEKSDAKLERLPDSGLGFSYFKAAPVSTELPGYLAQV
jgi:hypothetical protein